MTSQPKTCPREYEVDQFWLAEGRSTAPEDSHLARCETCRGALNSYREIEQEFEREVFPATIEEVLRRAPRIRDTREKRGQIIRLSTVLVPLAAAAMIAFVVVFQNGSPDNARPHDPRAYVGEKGGPGFGVYCQRGDKVFQLSEGDTIFENDALRFSPLLSDSLKHHAMVVSVNDGGELQAYFPLNGTESLQIEGGRPLPGSVVMDESQGEERLFFLVSAERFTLSEVRDAVKKAFAKTAGRAIPHSLPIDLEQASIGLRKEKQ